jgi:uncharacterized protein YyaL (SSP411 family)
MNPPTRRCLIRFAAMVLWLGGLSVSCRKKEEAGAVGKSPVKVASGLESNRIGDLPGAVYRSQRESLIPWQPWTAETLELARESKRLVLLVIAMPQQPVFEEVLEKMAADPLVLDEIRRTCVPVLVDGDASRELGLLTADLCAEIRRPLALPLLVWMTHEANPVAWIPLSGDAGRIRTVFDQSNSVIGRMAAEDLDHVMKNSALDQELRRARIAARRNESVASGEPGVDVLQGIRQLTSLYDVASRTFDEAGGLFPAGSLDLLAAAAMSPAVSEDLRGRCLVTLRELMADLLPSAMFDPLDGGLSSSRRGVSWSLPTYVRDAVSQARSAVALIRVHQATGDALALERALAVLRFAEREYQVAGGVYSMGFQRMTPVEDWLWSVEEVEQALSADDAAWWIRATGMSGLGNLPSEVDPRRDFFRRNSLALARGEAEVAASANVSRDRYEEVRKKLLKVRDARMGGRVKDESAHAGATFRMISAFAAAYAATGDEAWRSKAVEALDNARRAFSDGRGLRMFDRAGPPSVVAGRAFVYALALQAILDVADIQPAEALLSWADDLATTAAERFTSADFLKECPEEAQIMDLPVTDLVMLFDDSTAGVISSVEHRMAVLGRPMVTSFSRLATPLPVFAAVRPILHTDLLQATLARHHGVTAVLGKGLPAELEAAVYRLPLRVVARRPATADEEVRDGTVRVVSGGVVIGAFTSVEELHQALLPSGGNR